ncbi:MAG: winged helix-turn-helix domain-containing protein [Firmicutes bacterium]|nr:winged helix-turn-helix domain-containing protein [Bacillota bacterium]
MQRILLAGNMSPSSSQPRENAGSRKTIREKVLSYLEYESRRQHSRQIILPCTKKELAEKFGVRRTSLSRELARMRTDGLIDYNARSITLLEPQRPGD